MRQWRETGGVRDRRGDNCGRPFARRYTLQDIRLLAAVDAAFGQMSGLATREVLRRRYEVFGDDRFVRLTTVSNGHVYNLRGSRTYVAARKVRLKTQAAPVGIGLRRAPEPNGRPGYVRVDTVHQGGRDGEKGLYLINLVDQITQFELVGTVAGISERFLAPLLEGLLLSFPFPIRGFHADNGSEYINHRVAELSAILIMVADRMLRKLSLPFLAPTRHKNRYCSSFPLRVWLVSCHTSRVASTRPPWSVARRAPQGMVHPIAKGRNAATGQGERALWERTERATAAL